MSPLTVPEKALLRATTEEWFTDTCTIKRDPASADDVYGGRGKGSGAQTTVATGVACMLESGAEHVQDRALLAKIENIHAFTVIFPALTNVLEGDYLTITSQSSMKLRVQAVLAPETIELERRVIATEMEAG